MKSALHFVLPFVLYSSALKAEEESLPRFCEDQTIQIYEDAYAEKKYTILQNVSYAKLRGRDDFSHLMGELDVLVLDGRQVFAVAEVKYAGSEKNLKKAIKKARDQMNRFVVHCLVRRCAFVKDNELLDITVPRNIKEVKLQIVTYTDAGNFLHRQILDL